VSTRQKEERFAKLPWSVLMHPSVTTLSHAAFRVLTVVAAGYHGENNGALACTDTWLRRFGMVSKDTVYRSLHELTARGLIEVTRPGIKHRRVPTLYAITWAALNFREGEILGRFSPASHAYRQWQAPPKVKKKVPDRRKVQSDGRTIAEFQSDGRASISPMVGPETSIISPIMSTKVGGSQSDGRVYLRISDGFSDSDSDSPSASCVSPSSDSRAQQPREPRQTTSQSLHDMKRSSSGAPPSASKKTARRKKSKNADGEQP
jgi:hypothetical protein